MILTGLEIILITAGASLITAVVASVITSCVRNRTGKVNFADSKDFHTRVGICSDRFDRGDKKMKETDSEVTQLSRRFERFIVYSDLTSEIKAKILDGE
jgi:hypothetical protein